MMRSNPDLNLKVGGARVNSGHIDFVSVERVHVKPDKDSPPNTPDRMAYRLRLAFSGGNVLAHDFRDMQLANAAMDYIASPSRAEQIHSPTVMENIRGSVEYLPSAVSKRTRAVQRVSEKPSRSKEAKDAGA